MLQLEVSDSVLTTNDQVKITVGEEDGGGSSGSAGSIDLSLFAGFLVLILLRAAPGLALGRK
ncbi:MAG: hypothetical protein GY785_06155 [Gammaproteobacteria bacterium]|nr:hypothetical protein [Gammaproteobacteria bacterium]MCP4982660.1 hypothetical protein [Gammaproteobacteria bacterium]